MAKSNSGRNSIFRGKSKRNRIQGIMTNVGAAEFERRRRWLAKLVGRKPAHVSDADTVEALSRGEAATIAYLEQQK